MRRLSTVIVGAAVWSMLLFGAIAPTVSAAPNESSTPITNPNLVAKCGIDILVILDESGSIDSADATDEVIDAFKAFTGAIKNTGSRMAVVEFDTTARMPLPGPAAQNYTTVTDGTIASVFDPYIDNDYEPEGSTHWEDAFRLGRYFLPRPSPAIPHLVVFITDGDPNEIVRNDRVTYDAGNPNLAQNEYELKTELLADNETSNADSNPAKDRAVSNANALKAAGSHVLAIAVGNGLSSTSSLNRIIAVSGPDVFPGSGPFDITEDDVYREDDFDQLETALRNAAFALCAPSVNIRKLVDLDPTAGENLQPTQGWSMQATVTPTPTDWVMPNIAAVPSATNITGPDGFVSFQWTTLATTPSSSISVTETIQTGFFNDPTATTCSFRTPEAPNDQPLPITRTNGGFSGTVPRRAIVTCTMVNRTTAVPAITIKKFTNGVDADAPTGPLIASGSEVVWTYRVTNTGNVPVTGVAVDDSDPGVSPVCNATTLAPGASTECEATGIAVTGQYANTGTATATATGPTGPIAVGPVSDPSHYFGVAPGIDIEKATNGVDADSAPGPFIPVGDDVEWTYVVTNTGDLVLTDVVVTDDILGTITASCEAEIEPLDPDESRTCTVTGTAEAGQYANLATVTADSTGGEIQDSDGSHYFGTEPDIDVEKFVNLQDADDPTGPLIEVGRPVAWTYRIENTGNVPLTWSVEDDQFPGTPLACTKPILTPGQVILCFGPLGATAQPGQQTNTAAVTGTTIGGGAQVSDTDDANYFGVLGDIDIEKFTNDEDADQAPGPFVVPGSTVEWTYEVTNTGNAALTNVIVVDLNGVVVDCGGQTTLGVGLTMTCTASAPALPDQYTNLSSVTAETPVGTIVSDEDPSNYFGSVPGIVIQKATNGDDADLAPGPFIPVGGEVHWTYAVTNSGNAPVSNVVVIDDQAGVTPVFTGGDTDGDSQLDLTEEWAYEAFGTATIGQYENLGTVTGNGAAGAPVTDDDPSHYFGFVSDIEIVKTTNGDDANTAPGVLVPVGGTLTWTYTVTNPGNIPITEVVVTDDQGVTPAFVGGDTNADDRLDPSETWTYQATGTAAAGQYTNVGTVNGLDLLEEPVTDLDPSNAFGYAVDIDIEKDPAEATVDLGAPHRFTITVTNTGTAALTGVTVTDPVTPACDRVIGDLAVGTTIAYPCDVAEVTAPIENTASVVGFGPSQETVDDSDVATVVPVAALIGDLVWEDVNKNQIQDAGESGIADARVDVTDVDRGGTQTYTTDADGHYLASLRAGHYMVVLDMTSVDSTLTTPGSYDITLAAQEERLDADFGIVHDAAAAPDTSTAIDEFRRILGEPASSPGLVALLVVVLAGAIGAAAFMVRRVRAKPSAGAHGGDATD